MDMDSKFVPGFEPQEELRVCVALVKFEHTEPATGRCIQNLLAKTTEGGVTVSYQEVTGCNVHMGREAVCMQRQDDHTHILFVDDDNIFPEDALLRLLAYQLPLVGAFYIKNTEPYIPNVMIRKAGSDWDFDNILTWDEIARTRQLDPPLLSHPAGMALATGFLLIDTRVFKQVPQPWFWYRWCPSSDLYDYWSSDTDFCIKCHEHNIPVTCDTGLDIGHIGKFVFEYKHFEAQRDKYEQMARRQEYKKAYFMRAVKESGERHPDINTPEYWDGRWQIDSGRSPNESVYPSIVDAIQPGNLVVDLGSGPGMFADALTANVECDVVCVDHSPWAIDTAKEKGYQARLMDFTSMDGELNDLKGRADVVVATEILEHLDKPEELVELARFLLRKNGALVVSTPNGCMTPADEPEHRKTWTLRGLAAFLEESFEHVEGYEIGNYALCAAHNRE